MLSCVWLFVTPWTIVCQAPLSKGFSRQEYWSVTISSSTGSSSPRDQTHISCIGSGFFITEPPGSPNTTIIPSKLGLPKGPKSYTMPINFSKFEQVQAIHFLLTNHQDVIRWQHSNWRACWREKKSAFQISCCITDEKTFYSNLK